MYVDKTLFWILGLQHQGGRAFLPDLLVGALYCVEDRPLRDHLSRQVLNVSSSVTWLELDDKALLESYTVLQEGILCDVFLQKCSAAWQGAPGQRLTVAIMLPGRQLADDSLDFMLSQRSYGPPLLPGGLSKRRLPK